MLVTTSGDGELRVSNNRSVRRPQANDDDGSTEWFMVRELIRDRDLAAHACNVVLDLVKFTAARAVVDAYTDHGKVMPSDAEAAEDMLRGRGKLQHKRDPGMNVVLDLSDAKDWDLLNRYAPWSINVDVYDAGDDLIANLHDCGLSVSARLSADQAARLTDALAGHLHVETEEAFQARERYR